MRGEGDFDQLYAAHRQTLHAFVLGRTGDAELALDLLQEAFVRAWRNLDSLLGLPVERQRHGSSPWRATWSSTTTGRRQLAARPLTRQAVVDEASAAGADDEALERQRLEQLDAAIWQLPEELRTVLLLSVLDGRSSTQIGDALGRPAGTVRYQLAQARRRLALALSLDDGATP